MASPRDDMTTLRGALRRAAQALAEAGSDEAALEAELLLAHALSTDRPHLYQRLSDGLPPGASAPPRARRNAERHGVAARIGFREGDLLAPLAAHPEPKPGGSRGSSRRVDVIAANLPYLRRVRCDLLHP